MTDNGENRIQQLFLAALERPSSERDAWLVEQCGQDASLLAEVRSLLEHDTPVDDPLEQGLDRAWPDLPNTQIACDNAPAAVADCTPTLVESTDFLHRLSEIGVLSAQEVSDLTENITSGETPSDPQLLASRLVSEGKLTAYQASALLKGQPELLIDKYLILDLLDAGGMGMVFKAIHRPMKRVVAIKMISQHLLSSAEQAKRFQREVRVAATLEHANIVRAYDADQSRGVHFLVMEYVRGENLAKVIRRQGPLPLDKAVDVIRQAAHGLSYAHHKGVVHRDIKPANLMLTDDGLVKVLDLGLANIDESFRLAQKSSQQLAGHRDTEPRSHSDLTSAGAILGTVSYMAPEQSLDSNLADARSDVYSLGCTLYFLLTGEAPYRGDSLIQVFMEHHNQPVPSLRDKRPDVPEPVDAFCRKMLAKSPDERFASMKEVLTAIDECNVAIPVYTATPKPRNTEPLRGINTPQTSVESGGRSSVARWSMSPVWWGVVGTGCLLVALTQAYHWWPSSPVVSTAPTAPPPPQAPNDKPSPSNEAMTEISEALTRAAVLRDQGQMPDSPAIRLVSPQHRLIGHSDRPYRLAYSPTEPVLVSGSIDCSIRFWDSNSDAELATRRITLPGPVWAVAISPDGATLAAGLSNGMILLVDAISGEVIASQQAHEESVTAVQFTRGASAVASAGWDGKLREWRTPRLEEIRQINAHDDRVHSLEINRDGTQWVTASMDQTVAVWEASTGAEVSRLRGHTQSVSRAVFSRDGKSVASCGRDGQVRISEIASGNPTGQYSDSRAILALAYTPNGEFLAILPDGPRPVLLETRNLSPVAIFDAERGVGLSLLVSPDGRQLASSSSDNTITLWDLSINLGRLQ